MCFKKQGPRSTSALLLLVNAKTDPCVSQPHRGHITSNSTPIRLAFYLFLTLLLYFLFIFYFLRCTLQDFHFVSSLASLRFLSCFIEQQHKYRWITDHRSTPRCDKIHMNTNIIYGLVLLHCSNTTTFPNYLSCCIVCLYCACVGTKNACLYIISINETIYRTWLFAKYMRGTVIWRSFLLVLETWVNTYIYIYI